MWPPPSSSPSPSRDWLATTGEVKQTNQRLDSHAERLTNESFPLSDWPLSISGEPTGGLQLAGVQLSRARRRPAAAHSSSAPATDYGARGPAQRPGTPTSGGCSLAPAGQIIGPVSTQLSGERRPRRNYPPRAGSAHLLIGLHRPAGRS